MGWSGETFHLTYQSPHRLPMLQQVTAAPREQGGMDGLFLPQLLREGLEPRAQEVLE